MFLIFANLIIYLNTFSFKIHLLDFGNIIHSPNSLWRGGQGKGGGGSLRPDEGRLRLRDESRILFTGNGMILFLRFGGIA